VQAPLAQTCKRNCEHAGAGDWIAREAIPRAVTSTGQLKTHRPTSSTEAAPAAALVGHSFRIHQRNAGADPPVLSAAPVFLTNYHFYVN
jgi:hypothetical protein